MSDARARRVWIVFLATVSAMQSAPAQTVAEYTKHVDSIGAIWRAAAQRAASTVNTVPSTGPSTDTVRVGNFVILADSGLAPLARQTAEIVSPKLDRAYGGSAAKLRERLFVLRRRFPDTTQVQSGVLDAQGVLRIASFDYALPASLAPSWQRKAEEYITIDLAPSIRQWLGTVVPSDPATVHVLSNGRIELVLASSRAARDCAQGDLERCRRALGLVATEDPAFVLFDETERRAMFERNATLLRRADEPKYARCTVENQQAACDSLLRSVPSDAVPSPVSPTVRQNFLRYALLIGGDSAFDRLAAAPGDMSDRIASAARMPIDSVLQRWHDTLIHSRSNSTAIDLATAVSSILWAALCGALALRSSRWR